MLGLFYKCNLVIFNIREKLQLNIFLGRVAIAIGLATTVVGHYMYFLEWKRVKREMIEMRSAQLALHPLLLAERDRA